MLPGDVLHLMNYLVHDSFAVFLFLFLELLGGYIYSRYQNLYLYLSHAHMSHEMM